MLSYSLVSNMVDMIRMDIKKKNDKNLRPCTQRDAINRISQQFYCFVITVYSCVIFYLRYEESLHEIDKPEIYVFVNNTDIYISGK